MGICAQNLQCENTTITVYSSSPRMTSLYESLQIINNSQQKLKTASFDLSQTESTLANNTLNSSKSSNSPILCKLINRKANRKSTPHPICTYNYGKLIGIKNPCEVSM